MNNKSGIFGVIFEWIDLMINILCDVFETVEDDD